MVSRVEVCFQHALVHQQRAHRFTDKHIHPLVLWQLQLLHFAVAHLHSTHTSVRAHDECRQMEATQMAGIRGDSHHKKTQGHDQKHRMLACMVEVTGLAADPSIFM